MRFLIFSAALMCFAVPLHAQETGTTEEAAEPSSDAAVLLTDEELQTLVAPVALYPDTLLIQIFVAATEPLEIVKAERFLLDNAGRDPAELEPEIDAMGWDPSVAVLATAFPEVIGEMATHIDWTETMGTAMLAQSEDVLDAVQVMRDLAIDSGALVSGEEQTVEVAEDDTVVITPTDPEVVYVPQYVPSEVYTGPSTGDVVGAALLTFATVAIIDEIFDDDDDWYDYWGCRYCGGWNGGPIIRDPDIDIDIDIDRDIDVGNRPDLGWDPDPVRVEDARDRIENRERPDTRPGQLPVERPDGRTDQLREQLTERTGTEDISRPEARDRAAQVAAGAGAGAAAGAFIGSREQGSLPQIDRGDATRDRSDAKAQAVANTKERAATGTRPAVQGKPQVAKKPQVQRSAPSVQRKPKASAGKAMKKHSGGNKARSASARGKASKAKMRRR